MNITILKTVKKTTNLATTIAVLHATFVILLQKILSQKTTSGKSQLLKAFQNSNLNMLILLFQTVYKKFGNRQNQVNFFQCCNVPMCQSLMDCYTVTLLICYIKLINLNFKQNEIIYSQDYSWCILIIHTIYFCPESFKKPVQSKRKL